MSQLSYILLFIFIVHFTHSIQQNETNSTTSTSLYKVRTRTHRPPTLKATTTRGRRPKPTSSSSTIKSTPPTKSNQTLVDEEKAQLAWTRIRAESEVGRVLALFCRIRCAGERERITKWLEDFHAAQKIPTEQQLVFIFHGYRLPLNITKVDEAIRRHPIALFQFVAGQGFQFDGDVNSEAAVSKWLHSFEQPPIEQPADHVGFDALLNKAGDCDDVVGHRFVLLIHDPHLCPDALLTNIARSFRESRGVTVAELRRPLSPELEAVLHWRLPLLSDSCRMLVYLHRNTYYEVERNILPSLLHKSLLEWEGADCGNGTATDYAIRSRLTEIQLEYFSEERIIRRIQENQIYVIVGGIGGVAVCLLAISIFWGLNA